MDVYHFYPILQTRKLMSKRSSGLFKVTQLGSGRSGVGSIIIRPIQLCSSVCLALPVPYTRCPGYLC